MAKRFFYFVFFFWRISLPGHGQRPDSVKTHILEEVVITVQPRLKEYSTGSKIEKIDSAQLARYPLNNLSDIFSQNNLLFIKSYGLGSLASPSFRGTSANHTAVLWNGFNLQSPMYGQLDFALVPQEFVNDISVQFGGKSALFGSGAIGGTVHLNNTARFNTGVKASLSTNISSFGGFRESAQLQLSQQRIITSVKFFNYRSQNDFPFEYGGIEKKQTHAAINQQGLLVEEYFKPSEKQQINIRYWYQNNNRQIPPLITQDINLSTQKDEFHRLTGEWQKTGKIMTLIARAAYFDEQLIYRDPVASPYSYSRSRTLITEAESKINISPSQSLNFGFNNTYTKAISDGYPNYPELNRTSAFGSYKASTQDRRLAATISFRQEMLRGKLVPFTPSFGIEYLLVYGLTLKSSLSRSYRVPTFNELYWRPGGNPHLRPESSWSQDFGIHYTAPAIQHGTLSIPHMLFNATFFNNYTNNWIIWLPSANGNYWEPKNINAVWARGFEFSARIQSKIGAVNVDLSANYDYTLSTSDKVSPGNENQLHKQLIYVPFNKSSVSLLIGYRGFGINYSQNYVGYRYTTSDNNVSNLLSSYSIGNLQLSKILRFNKLELHVFGRINNLWNESYQVIAVRAMPQRNYLAGIAIQFIQPNKP